MYYDVIRAACLKNYCIYLQFEDGREGIVDLEPIVGKGEIFAPLQDMDCFCRMTVDERAGTIAWPNEADISPEALYEAVKKSINGVARYEL